MMNRLIFRKSDSLLRKVRQTDALVLYTYWPIVHIGTGAEFSVQVRSFFRVFIKIQCGVFLNLRALGMLALSIPTWYSIHIVKRVDVGLSSYPTLDEVEGALDLRVVVVQRQCGPEIAVEEFGNLGAQAVGCDGGSHFQHQHHAENNRELETERVME